MDPTYGRFNALNRSDDGLLFVRLQVGPIVEVIASEKAYRSVPMTEANAASFVIQGRRGLPSETLVALLLAIPSATCTIQTKPSSISPLQSESQTMLEIRCVDSTNLQLCLTIQLIEISPRPLLDELHQSFISALAAMEATMRDAGGDKNSNFLADAPKESISLTTVEDQFLPLIAMEQRIETLQVFRKAAAADARVQANRAFVLTHHAGTARAEKLQQRRMKKELEQRKKQQERERMRELKKRMAEARERKQQVGMGRGRKKTLFENDDGEDVKKSNEPRENNAVSGPTRRETKFAEGDERNEVNAMELEDKPRETGSGAGQSSEMEREHGKYKADGGSSNQKRAEQSTVDVDMVDVEQKQDQNRNEGELDEGREENKDAVSEGQTSQSLQNAAATGGKKKKKRRKLKALV